MTGKWLLRREIERTISSATGPTALKTKIGRLPGDGGKASYSAIHCLKSPIQGLLQMPQSSKQLPFLATKTRGIITKPRCLSRYYNEIREGCKRNPFRASGQEFVRQAYME